MLGEGKSHTVSSVEITQKIEPSEPREKDVVDLSQNAFGLFFRELPDDRSSLIVRGINIKRRILPLRKFFHGVISLDEAHVGVWQNRRMESNRVETSRGCIVGIRSCVLILTDLYTPAEQTGWFEIHDPIGTGLECC